MGFLTGVSWEEIEAELLNYSLVDGTRPFTGPVGGVTPVAASDLATREYVDLATAGIGLDFFLTEDASDIGGYFIAQTAVGGAEENIATAVTTGDTLLVSYATPANVPSLTTLKSGAYHVHLHGKVNATVGTKTAVLFARLYTRTHPGGVETLQLTTENSSALTVTSGPLELHGNLPADVAINATDRFVLKVYAQVSGAGADPTVTIYTEGDTAANFEVPTILAMVHHDVLAGLGDDDHTQYHTDARGDARYALIANGVTNGNSHDHSGGDGAQIDHGGLAGLADDDHSQYHTDARHAAIDAADHGSGAATDGYVLTADGAGGAAWEAGAGILSWASPYGLTLSNGTDATNDIDIAVGDCNSDESTPASRVRLQLTSALTKQLDATWAAGDDAGGRVDGQSLADGTWHVFLFKRSGGSFDVCFSNSLTFTTPDSGTNRRRLGSIIRASGAIVGFVQFGDAFSLKTGVRDWIATNPGTDAILVTTTIPSGIKLQVVGNAQIGAHASAYTRLHVSDPDTTDFSPTDIQTALQPAGGSSYFAASGFTCMSNTSGQVRVRCGSSDAGTIGTLSTFMWIDQRRV